MKSNIYNRQSKVFGGLSVPAALLLVMCVSLISFKSAASAPSNSNDFKATTVFLVRHAEKSTVPPEDPPLLETGSARAKELAKLLSRAGVKAIYTSQFLRTKQTAEPIAKSLGIAATILPIRMNPSNPKEISEQSIREIIDKIYERAGENALVVGHSNTIPVVIKMLGGDTVPTIDEKDFDDLFVVTLYEKGKAKVAHLKYGGQQ